MTATERLRELLDERGVEHEDFIEVLVEHPANMTRWQVGGHWYGADTWDDTEMMSLHCITPEQAIEATLGRGTCRDKGNIERFICSECGCRLDLQDDDWEATMWLDDGAATVPRYCPNCGAKAVYD